MGTKNWVWAKKTFTPFLPNSWGSLTSLSYIFNGCYSLININLPDSWGLVTASVFMFAGCNNLTKITLPAAYGITSVQAMFANCFTLRTITNLEYLGSLISPLVGPSFLSDCEFLQQEIIITSLVSSIAINGTTISIKVASIRLSNPNSLFGGSSPHVDVSYTSLDAAALDLLFGDLPTRAGKTINITGAIGAATCTKTIATGKGWTVTG